MPETLLSWGPIPPKTATKGPPFLGDGYPGIVRLRQLPHPRACFPASRSSRGFPRSPGCSASCWATPHRSTRPGLAQLQDQRAQSQQQRCQQLKEWGKRFSYPSEAMFWNNNPPCMENIDRQARSAVFTPRMEGEVTSYGGE